MRLLLSLTLSLGLVSFACGGDDDGGGDAPDAADSPFDAAPACVLPSEVVTCAGEGDDGPCQAVCAEAYCRDFGNLPDPVCTQNCETADDCADGWDCNDMGRCRPPG
jgi:hypothetical protein